MAGVRGRWILIVAAVVVAVLLAVLLVAPGMLICPAVGKGGSLALGVPVHLRGAGLKIFSGVIDLKGLEVGNPPGYTTMNAIEVGRINVRAPLTALLRRAPRIESITVEAPAVTLEQGLTGSNLSDLLANTGKPGATGGGKKLIIGSLRIVGAKVSVSVKLKGALPALIPLPPLELRELGGEGAQGVTLAQTMALSLREIIRSAVANGGGVIPPELGASLSSSVASVDRAGRQVVGAVSDTGKQAVGAVSDTGKQAVGAASSAAKGLMDGAKGLVK
ncbi:MAG: hypothetical protein WCP22_04265 [Chlamydiota bacterium]